MDLELCKFVVEASLAHFHRFRDVRLERELLRRSPAILSKSFPQPLQVIMSE